MNLGDVLALLHEADRSWTTIHGTALEWCDPEAMAIGNQRHHERMTGRSAALPPGAPLAHGGTVHEHTIEVWARADGSLRVERPDGHGTALQVVTANDRSVWIGPDGRARRDDGERPFATFHHRGLLGTLLWPRPMLGQCRLVVTGERTVAGRPAVMIEGEMANRSTDGNPVLGFGTSAIEVVVDVRRGVLLDFEAWVDGRPSQRIRFNTVEFDLPVADDRFLLDSPAGATVEPTVLRSLTLEDAAREVNFALFAPPRASGQGPWSAIVLPGSSGGTRTHVIVRQMDGLDARPWLTESTSAEVLPDVHDWAPFECAAGAGHYWQAADGQTHALMWRDGTGIWLHDASSLPAAVAFLEALRPAG